MYVSSAVETVLGYKPEEMSTAVFESSFTKESLEELQMVVNDIIKHIKLGEHEKYEKIIELKHYSIVKTEHLDTLKST